MLIFNQTDGSFICAQWIITPLANQRYLLNMTGVVEIDLACNQKQGWRWETVRLLPDFTDAFAYAGYDLTQVDVALVAEQYTSYGSLNSIFDQSTAVNAGFAVDAFRPYFVDGGRALTNGSGIDLDVAVQDADASIFRVGYQLTAVGQIKEAQYPPIE